MFFEGDRIVAVREMILADDEAGRRAALAKLLPMQRADFVELFAIMSGLPVTIRLLDPPLHEFLPHTEARARRRWRTRSERPVEQAAAPRRRAARVQPDARLPRLPSGGRLSGDRRDAGARDLRGGGRGRKRDRRRRSCPEIMVPLVDDQAPSSISSKARIVAMAEAVAEETGVTVRLPGRHDDRAAARRPARGRDRRERRVLLLRHQRPDPDDARHLARRRRDASSAPTRRRASCRPIPFVDARPGGRRRTGQDRRRARPRDAAAASSSASAASTAAIRPRSRFCQSVGLDYVSCSPYRVPIARLAAAQAALGGKAASQA